MSDCAGTTTTPTSCVIRAIGVTLLGADGRTAGQHRAHHDRTGHHQRIRPATPLRDEARQADNAARAADILELEIPDQPGLARHLLDRPAQAVPAATRPGRDVLDG